MLKPGKAGRGTSWGCVASSGGDSWVSLSSCAHPNEGLVEVASPGPAAAGVTGNISLFTKTSALASRSPLRML